MKGRVLYLSDGGRLSYPFFDLASRSSTPMEICLILPPSALFQSAQRKKSSALRQASPVPLHISFLNSGFPPRCPKLLAWQVRQWISAVAPSVIHARDLLCAGIAGRVLASLAANRRPKLVFEVTRDRSSQGPNFSDPRTIESIRALERDACRWSTALLASSTSLSNFIQTRNSFPGTAQVIPAWGAIPPDFRPPTDLLRSSIRQALKIPEEAFVWCVAIEARTAELSSRAVLPLKALRNDDARHFGFFVTDEPDILRSRLGAAGLPDESFLVGSGVREDTLRWMVAADAGIELSRYPAVLPDYLLVGLPVLMAEHAGDASKWVRESACGEAVPDLSPQALYSAALKLAKRVSIEGRAKLREKTRRLFDERFDLCRYLPVYHDLWTQASL